MVKEKIKELLFSTERKGVDKLLEQMDEIGFFDAPASTKFHGAKDGMLAEHSLNVYEYAHKLAKSWLSSEEYKAMADSITLCAILHDLGKAGDYGKKNYIENTLKNGKRSEKIPFVKNSELSYVDHEIRSIKICSKYIELTEKEEFAILYHNGMYGNLKYALQGKETPLQMIIHFADMWASRVIEKENPNDEI